MNTSIRTRSFLLFMLFCTIYLLVIGNLYLIQIRDMLFFTQLGFQQHHIMIEKKPPRASIIDRHHKPLALNNDSVAAFILPNKLIDPIATTDFLTHHFPAALAQLANKKNSHFMYIQRKLSPEQVTLIKNKAPQDIQLLHESSRLYPVPCTASVVGKTDIDNNGILGIELQFNNALAGEAQRTLLQKDARSGYFYSDTTHLPKNIAPPIQLTIDSNLQFLVSQELEKTVTEFCSDYGCALIMDPHNGEILSMITYPYFDPNALTIDSLEHTKNRVISDSYELGSVIKTFAALAALASHAVTADELINCKNTKSTYIDGRPINTWKEDGTISFTDVMASSNNIGIAIVAKRIGASLYTHYKKLGFGKKTGITLPGEQIGFVNHPKNWSKQSIISLSYGYEITATLLQIGTAFCIIANNGYYVPPTIIFPPSITTKPTINTHINRHEKRYSDEHIATIKQILERTTERGTAKRASIKGYRIMSKTGTACQLIDGVYDKDKNLYTCAGIIEKGDYQRVLVTFIKGANRKKLFASNIAAPLFCTIAQKMLIHERII